uniref:Uncharacterized protein n=1 Tax=Balaenoptera musculus TaxID=9771 RepID=A0A8C0DWQ8_BALMU
VSLALGGSVPWTTKEISELRNILKQLQPGTSGCSACMVLSAAPKAPPARVVSPKHNHAEPGPGHRDSTGPLANSWSLTILSHRPVFNSNSRPKQRGLAKAGQREHQQPQARSSGVQDSRQCPICAGSFSIVMLPQHATTCGETSPPPQASPSSSPSSSPSVLWVSSPESSPPISWVQCPICQLLFSAGEIEEHVSMCGEVLPA